jgi:hypothetical protein
VRSVVTDTRDAELIDGHDAADVLTSCVEGTTIEQRGQATENAAQMLHERYFITGWTFSVEVRVTFRECTPSFCRW